MIVISKRVFLNILTQIMDAQSLVDANYYIADQRSRDGTVVCTEEYQKDPNTGQYTIAPSVKPTSYTPSLNRFHIHYGSGTLSPLALNSQILVESQNKTTIEMFKQILLQTDSFIDTYRFLYGNKPVGNGLRILLFAKDDSAPYMHVVCEYLSHFFGESITFVDRAYRNDIPGQVNYAGNPADFADTVKRIRKQMLIKDLSDIITSYQYGVQGRANLEVFMDSFELPDLFGIYELLFPQDPLPQGNYTKERMVYILVSRIIAETPRVAVSSMNLMMNEDFDPVPELYEEVSDELGTIVHE